MKRNWIGKIIHLRNTFFLLGMMGVFVLAAIYLDEIMLVAETIIKNYTKSVFYTSVGCFAVGSTHAIKKRTKQDNVFFLKFLGNPFIAAIFTAITYGIMINACLALFYIIIYDKDIISKYPIDKVTTSVAVALLFVSAIYGLAKMIWEICRPLQTDAIVESRNTSEENKDNDK